jgi:hypothetical protein
MACIASRSRGIAALVTALIIGAVSQPTHGFAQPSAQDRENAADAYDRGVSAFLSEDYAAAAHWFETANRLAPSAAALVQAIRSHDRAGNDMRAATLSLRLVDNFPDEEQAVGVAEGVIEEAKEQYFLVTVECTETCAIDVNGALEGHNRFFVEPGRRVTVTAEFPGGRLSEEVQGRAGGHEEVSFTAPPPPPEPDPATLPVAAADGATAADEGGGLPRPLFWSMLGVTAAAGGVLTWSGIDTRNGVDAYEMSPTAAGLEAGQDKELRTNALIGVTSGLAATTLLIAIFTDWNGDDDDQGTRASVRLSPSGAMMDLEGHF